MTTAQKKRTVRIGKKLKFSIAELESIAAKHDAEHERGIVRRPKLGKLNELFDRFPSSADVPPQVAVPVSKKDYARLVRLAERSGQGIESLVALWVRQRLARMRGS